MPPDPALEARFQTGLALHQQGRIADAVRIYQEILGHDAGHFDALHCLGVAHSQNGEYALAVERISQAIAIIPGVPAAHANRGSALHGLGRFEEAVASFDRAIALAPDYAEAWFNRANALHDLKRPDDSIASYDRAIALAPNYAQAHANRANVLQALRRFEEAVTGYNRAIAFRPDFAGAWFSRGNALQALGRLEEAITSYDNAIALAPSHAAAWNNSGLALADLDRLDDAAARFAKAIQLRPDDAQAHHNLGDLSGKQGDVQGAIASFRRALEIDPADAAIQSNLLFHLHFAAGVGSAAILEEARTWAARHEAPLSGAIEPHTNSCAPGRRLKIGYVSASFRQHAVAPSLLPVIAAHDRTRFEIFCYSDIEKPDAITARFRKLDVVWRDTARLSDAALAEQIRADGIDILIDGIMHMGDRRLLAFARRPAPVQVTWLAYPGTTGLGAMDYRLTDPYLDPPGQNDALYSERSIRLPHSFWAWMPLLDLPAPSALPARANGHVTFGAFNNFRKVTPQSLALWAQVLAAVPNARLKILAPPGSHRAAVLQSFAKAGIGAERIQFVPPSGPDSYYRNFHDVDLCLDPIPYPGHQTTFDSLWMGVPVVTLTGETVAARGGVSILSNMGLQSFIAHSAQDYVAIAQQAAQDLDGLEGLRKTLRGRMQAAPFMDAPGYARDLEDAYAAMWAQWCGQGR